MLAAMVLKALSAPETVASIYKLWHQGDGSAAASTETERLADVSFLGADPLDFQEQIEARFARQRRCTPATPYAFAIPELAATLAFLNNQTRLQVMAYEQDLFYAPRHQAQRIRLERRGRSDELQALLSRLQAEAELFKLLARELDLIDPEQPRYDQLLCAVENFTRFLAVASPEPLPPLAKPYERFMASAVDDAVTELARYRSQPWFYDQRLSRFPVNRELIFAPQLKVLLLPMTGYLLDPVFVATRWSDLILSTVACRNYLVDGYVVTPYTFQKHDVSYHAGLRYNHDQRYFSGWSGGRIRAFRRLQRDWGQHLLQETERLADPVLKQAVYWLLLEVLHNRGWTLAPSSFRRRRDRLHIRLRNDIKNLSLVLMDQPTGCGDRLESIFKNSAQAQAWITDFWQAHYGRSPY